MSCDKLGFDDKKNIVTLYLVLHSDCIHIAAYGIKGIRIKSGNIISGSIISGISNSERINSGIHKNRNA